MSDEAANDAVTLVIPAEPGFSELPRVALAALLRIHRIDPGEVGDLGVSVQHEADSITRGGDPVHVHYRVTDSEVLVTLDGGGHTVRLGAPRA